MMVLILRCILKITYGPKNFKFWKMPLIRLRVYIATVVVGCGRLWSFVGQITTTIKDGDMIRWDHSHPTIQQADSRVSSWKPLPGCVVQVRVTCFRPKWGELGRSDHLH